MQNINISDASLAIPIKTVKYGMLAENNNIESDPTSSSTILISVNASINIKLFLASLYFFCIISLCDISLFILFLPSTTIKKGAVKKAL